MIYQRQMPAEELFSAQLELLMQNGRLATIGVNLVGVAAAFLLFWPYVSMSSILLWTALFIILLLVRSLHMTSALVERRYQENARRVYWQLIVGSALTGLVWSALYIYTVSRVPITVQYIFLLFIVSITAFSIGFSVAVREYFLAYVFTALWPIAWWSLVHYWEQDHNLAIGLVLLSFVALLVSVSDKIHNSFRNMISLNWERETLSQELGNLTVSLRDRNRQLLDARRQLTDLANIDELTGLGNRRLVNSVLQAEINRSRRNGIELSVILLDVDFFKNYNDALGHPAGDEVLQRLADVMERAASRAGEVVARYGGEEFILILPGASRDSAIRTAERLQEMVLAEGISHPTSTVSEWITISQGVVTLDPESEMQPDEVIKLADTLLYQAKDNGRNAIAVG